MHGDKFGSVGEGTLDLYLVEEGGDFGHDVINSEQLPGRCHEIGNAVVSVSRFLHDDVGNEGYCLWVVELLASGFGVTNDDATFMHDE